VTAKNPCFSDQITPSCTDCTALLVKLEDAQETSHGPRGACNSEKKESIAADARQRAQNPRFAHRTVHAPSFCDFLSWRRACFEQAMASPSPGDGPAAEPLTVSTGSPKKTLSSFADFLKRRKAEPKTAAKSEAVAVPVSKDAGQSGQKQEAALAPLSLGTPEEAPPGVIPTMAARVKKGKFGSRKSSPNAAAVAAGPSARVAREELVLAPKPDAAAALDVTVVEARGVTAGLCFFRINVEGSVGSTASLEGPDAVFHVTEVSFCLSLFVNSVIADGKSKSQSLFDAGD
jgi:hypothetical protein